MTPFFFYLFHSHTSCDRAILLGRHGRERRRGPRDLPPCVAPQLAATSPTCRCTPPAAATRSQRLPTPSRGCWRRRRAASPRVSYGRWWPPRWRAEPLVDTSSENRRKQKATFLLGMHECIRSCRSISFVHPKINA